MFLVMMLIPDQSGRVRLLRAYERELNHKLAFDSKFAEDLSKRHNTYNFDPGSQSIVRRITALRPSEPVTVTENDDYLTAM
jgi:hypothetical protein